MSNESKKIWLAWIFRVLWFAHSLLLVAIAQFNSAPLGKMVFSLIVSVGAWSICYLYFAKEDIQFSFAKFKHGENPVNRLVVIIVALATLYLTSLGLSG